MDIGYQPGKLDTVLVLTAERAIPDLEKQMNMPVSTDWDKAIRVSTEVYQNAQAEGDANVYHIFKYMVNRLEWLKKAKRTDVYFSVYRYNYSVKSVFNEKERTQVSDYYFFNQADSLLGYVDGDKFALVKRKFIQTETQPYDMAMIHLATGVELQDL